MRRRSKPRVAAGGRRKRQRQRAAEAAKLAKRRRAEVRQAVVRRVVRDVTLVIVCASVGFASAIMVKQVGPADGPDAGSFILHAVALLASVFLLARGADWFVLTSSRIASMLGVAPIVIGLTVVAFGTSAPEMVVTVIASLRGSGDLAVGNVVGSNIFNLGVILGGVVLLSKNGLPVPREVTRRDGPLLIGATLLLFLFVGSLSFSGGQQGPEGSAFGLFDLRLGVGEATLLLALLAGWIALLVRGHRGGRKAKRGVRGSNGDPAKDDSAARNAVDSADGDAAAADAVDDEPDDDVDASAGSMRPRDLALWALALGMVIGGGHVLVEAAVWYAGAFDVPQWVVAVTVVAGGTSAPEFAVSLLAALRGQYGLSVGALVGSDVFNLLGVLGVAGLVNPGGLAIDPRAVPSLAMVSGMVIMTVIFMGTQRRLVRWEGGVLLAVALGRWVYDFASASG